MVQNFAILGHFRLNWDRKFRPNPAPNLGIENNILHRKDRTAGQNKCVGVSNGGKRTVGMRTMSPTSGKNSRRAI